MAWNFAPDIQIVNDALTSANLFTARAYYTGEQLTETPEGFVVLRAPSYPAPVSTTHSGVLGLDFGDDWYGRVHLIPGQIDLGNLVSEQSRTVSVWNAFLTAKAFSALETDGFDGLELSPPAGVTPPTTLNALQLVTYTLTVDLIGPPTILATITYTIGGQDYTVPISGRRVVLMPFAPNWTQGVEETLLYRSTVTRSWDGTEQRRSLRRVPRRRLSYTALLRRPDAQKLDNLMYGWQGRLFAAPLWAESTPLAADAPVGASTLALDSSTRTFAVGGLLALWRDSGANEVHEIEAISEGAVTIRGALANAWPAGTSVLPAMVASLSEDVQTRRLTDSVVEAPFVFEGEPSSNVYAVGKGTAAALYQSQELYLHYTNWADGVEVSWTSDRIRIDQGTGQFRTVQRSGFSVPAKQHSWVLRDHFDVYALREWLQRREGQAIPFYTPSGFADFTVVSGADVADNAIDVESNGYDVFSNSAAMRRDLALVLRNGTVVCRRITTAAPNPDGTVKLQFDSALGVAFAAADVLRASLLGFYRLAADEITLSWRAAGVAEVRAGFVATNT